MHLFEISCDLIPHYILMCSCFVYIFVRLEVIWFKNFVVIMSSHRDKIRVYFIGSNSEGEFGLNHKNTLNDLTLSPQSSISRIFCGNNFTIYTDDKYSNIWFAGANGFGQSGLSINDVTTYTPIEYFKQNHINLHKICINPSGFCSLFIMYII